MLAVKLTISEKKQLDPLSVNPVLPESSVPGPLYYQKWVIYYQKIDYIIKNQGFIIKSVIRHPNRL